MRTNPLLSKSLATAILFAVLPVLAFAQTGNAVSSQAGIVPSRITLPIDEAQWTVLKGNTHPLARAEFDRGAATPGMTLHRMLLSLKRGPDQEAALHQLLVNLQDKSSPNYHQWLTPEQFGKQFGPSDQDMQTVTSWLESHGFQVTNVTKGRTVIEFTGTVSQVSEAFHTQIHKYLVRGEEHWANASDPQIPSALAGVVAGLSTLHNFVKKTHIRMAGFVGRGSVKASARPSITFNNGNHGVGPADFAKIYNVPNVLNGGATNGDGVTIAVVGRSNINVTDVQDFRSLFGITTAPGITSTFTAANIILNGPDPTNLGDGEEFEAVLDATWPGAVAPNATVKFVVSQTTETTDGVDLSEVFIIDENLAPIMTESFGLCEQQTVAGQATTEESLAEQAAAQGITFIASTGDAGAEGCDDPNSETVATGPIAVQIPAALPFTVALGGNQFTQNDAAFWNANNASGTEESATSYIPEDVWNESCLTANACFADVINAGAGPNILAGGGGASTIFVKPAFQTGVTGLSGLNREVPDVALNAAVFHDSTAICVADQQGSPNCVPVNNQFSVALVGGTSVAAPSFAGIMALVNQVTGSRQGEAGFVLYKLAAAEVANPGLAACNASTGSGPTSANCVFNDVTSGNNAVPGEVGFGNANAQFQAGTGYDEASGLGSVNVANLLGQWHTAQPNQSKTTLVSLVPPASHGGSAGYSVTVTAKTGVGVPTGDVSLIANTGASGETGGITLSTATLAAGTATGTTTALPGGTNYTVFAHYEGDATFLPSDSATMTVTVGKENSRTQVDFIAFDPNTFKETDNATTATYGANVIRINVTGVSGSCGGNAPGASGCPTGTITLKDGGNTLDGGSFALNSNGNTEDQAALLAPGNHSLTASYAGDASFNASGPTAADSITITQGPTNVALTSSSSSIASGGVVTLTAVVNTGSSGLAPTGTVQFFNGSTMIQGNVVLTPFRPNSFFLQGSATLTATLTTTLSAVPGAGPTRIPNLLRPYPLTLFALGALLFVLRYASANRRRYAYVGLIFAVFLLAGMAACGGGGGHNRAHTDTITAKYSGDTNYTGSTSTAVMINIQ